MWVDDLLEDEIEDLDLDTLAISEIELGSILGIPSGVDGSLYFDGFEIARGQPHWSGSERARATNASS